MANFAKRIRALLVLLMVLGGFSTLGVQTASAQASFNGTVEICTVNVEQGKSLLVRSGPGQEYNPVVGKNLPRGTKVVIFSSTAQWVKHGNGGWSYKPLMNCRNYERNQVIQSMLPTGYWLHETAVDFNGGRVPQYDVISGPDGSATQFFIPREGARIGNVVSFTQPAGIYSFKGVAAELFQDRQHNGVLTSEATHQNDKSYAVTQVTGWLRVVNDASPVNGFSVTPAGANAPLNSPYGTDPSTFSPDEAHGQFFMYSYKCETNEELPAFRAVKEPNGDISYPWLPSETVRAQTCWYTNVNVIEGQFEFNGIKAALYLDRERDGLADELVASHGNNLKFSVDTIPDNGESWGKIVFDQDPHSGASIRFISALGQK